MDLVFLAMCRQCASEGRDKYDYERCIPAGQTSPASKACAAVKAKGGTVTREAGPVKGGNTVIAFVQDPDGYKIEFIERK